MVRETVANAILFELKDPRVKNVTVTRAEVSGDLQHANLRVNHGHREGTATDDARPQERAGFLQTKVASQLTTRYVPHITFVMDEGVKKSVEIARMIREENERIAADHAANDPPSEADTEATEDADEIEHAEQPGPADGSAERPS
ncbi:MAG: 30S ribosome-binding factor RbfA [Gemmataceae bacterium]